MEVIFDHEKLDVYHVFQISTGSSFESAAVLDILHRTERISADECVHGKALLKRIVSMLTRRIRTQKQV